MKKYRFFGILFLLTAGCITAIAAGGMIDVLGEFETEHEELTEDTTVRVGDRDIILQAGSAASFYVQNGTRTDHLYQGRLAEDAAVSAYGKEITVRAPHIVWFYDNGNVMSGCLAEDTVFIVQEKEMTLQSGTPAMFYEDGTLKSGTLVGGSLYSAEG